MQYVEVASDVASLGSWESQIDAVDVEIVLFVMHELFQATL